MISVTDANGTAITDSTHIANVNPLRYRGYYFDSETGLYYLQSRYYDPVVKRFINADGYVSTGTGALGYNMFAYCLNNSVLFFDKVGSRPDVSGDLRRETPEQRKMSFACINPNIKCEGIKYYPKPNVSGMSKSMPREDFIRMMYARAKYDEEITKIPAMLMVAQACYESDYGRSDLSIYNRNLFGLSGHKFDSYDSCINYYENLLMGHYSELFGLQTVKEWIYAIGPAGYCSEAGYGAGIWSVVIHWDLEDESKWVN